MKTGMKVPVFCMEKDIGKGRSIVIKRVK
jgi:hypothetical protein